jgi:hypothetical protein
LSILFIIYRTLCLIYNRHILDIYDHLAVADWFVYADGSSNNTPLCVSLS